MDKRALRNGMGIDLLLEDSKSGSAPQVAQRPLWVKISLPIVLRAFLPECFTIWKVPIQPRPERLCSIYGCTSH